mgnify:CR=1
MYTWYYHTCIQQTQHYAYNVKRIAKIVHIECFSEKHNTADTHLSERGCLLEIEFVNIVILLLG